MIAAITTGLRCHGARVVKLRVHVSISLEMILVGINVHQVFIGVNWCLWADIESVRRILVIEFTIEWIYRQIFQ